MRFRGFTGLRLRGLFLIGGLFRLGVVLRHHRLGGGRFGRFDCFRFGTHGTARLGVARGRGFNPGRFLRLRRGSFSGPGAFWSRSCAGFGLIGGRLSDVGLFLRFPRLGSRCSALFSSFALGFLGLFLRPGIGLGACLRRLLFQFSDALALFGQSLATALGRRLLDFGTELLVSVLSMFSDRLFDLFLRLAL